MKEIDKIAPSGIMESKDVDTYLSVIGKKVDRHQKRIMDYILVRYLKLIPNDTYKRIKNKSGGLGVTKFYLGKDWLFTYKLFAEDGQMTVSIETDYPTDEIQKIKL